MLKLEDFEKLDLQKFKQDKPCNLSKLFGGAAGGPTVVITTKRTDSSDTGYPDPPEDDPDIYAVTVLTSYI